VFYIGAVFGEKLLFLLQPFVKKFFIGKPGGFSKTRVVFSKPKKAKTKTKTKIKTKTKKKKKTKTIFFIPRFTRKRKKFFLPVPGAARPRTPGNFLCEQKVTKKSLKPAV